MKLVIYSIILNHHQANIADELWTLTEKQFCFVELSCPNDGDKKGDERDYRECPYLLKAWKSREEYQQAMELAKTAECCIFSGIQALPFQKERMKLDLLSFDMSERWLKRGIKNLFSPAIFRMLCAYHVGKWGRKPAYKLCCSAFAARDQYRIGTYKDKCYKWGYFTAVDNHIERYTKSDSDKKSLMWCARFLKLKHPELPILLAEYLKSKGYNFTLDMYGRGPYEEAAMKLVKKAGVTDVVKFLGNKPNKELMEDMRHHDIFLFTSDRNEGWGAVANESMSNGCVLVASDAIGSAPYLVKDGETGMIFRSPKTGSSFNGPDRKALASLCEKVEYLFQNPEVLASVSNNGIRQMQETWNPKVAAARLLQLIDCLKLGKDTIFREGPCSRA